MTLLVKQARAARSLIKIALRDTVLGELESRRFCKGRTDRTLRFSGTLIPKVTELTEKFAAFNYSHG